MLITEPQFGRELKTGFSFIFIFAFLGSFASLAIDKASAETSAYDHTRESVAIPPNFEPGMIVIKQNERRLYYVTGPGMAIAYPIAIGRAGKAWRGETSIRGKFVEPAWSPPAEVRRDHPEFPPVIPGGSPRNPMGAAALTLDLAEVAIHGTTQTMRKSIGTAASYGCIRMYNEDVVDLFRRVEIGTKVVSIP